MTRRSATIEVAPAGRDPSGSRLVRRPRLDRLRAAGLPAVRPGSASRPALSFADELALDFVLSGRRPSSSTIYRDGEDFRRATDLEVRDAIFRLGLAVYAVFGPIE